MINRGLIIIRFKQPFVDWVSEADPHPGGRTRMTIEQLNDDSSAYLIHDYASDEFEDWLEECYELLFEQILEEWYVDPSLWPQDRKLKLFKAWCDVEVHSMVVDMVDGPLEDDDYD
jgi:cytochrome b involved in lipid metabolism